MPIRTRSPSPHSRGGDDAACGDLRRVSRAISQVAHYSWVDHGPCVSLRSKIFRPRLENCVCAKSRQSCPALCNPLDRSPPGSSVHGILQARILEWVTMPSSRGSFQPKNRTGVSCLVGGFFMYLTQNNLSRDPWDYFINGEIRVYVWKSFKPHL